MNAKILILAVLLVLGLAPGCSAWNRVGGPAILNCVEAKLAADAPGLVDKIVQIAEGGAPDKLQQIEALAASQGISLAPEIFGCAIQNAHLKTASPAAKAVLSQVAARRGFVYRGLPVAADAGGQR